MPPSRLELSAKEKLNKKRALSGIHFPLLLELASLLPSEIPPQMARTIAMFGMSTLAHALQAKIELSENNKIEIVTMSFVLAKSGAGKTSSKDMMDRALRGGFERIESVRELLHKAKEEEIGASLPELPPIYGTVSTRAGLLQYMEDFMREGIGAPALFVDEIATAMKSTTTNIVENLEVAAQVFDGGIAEVARLKGRENQTSAIRGMSLNCLFMGAEQGIMDDPETLKKVMEEFVSRLARRCFFCYPEFIESNRKDLEIDEVVKIETREEEIRVQKINDMYLQYKGIVSRNIDQDVHTIRLSPEAKNLMLTYKAYSKERGGREEIEACMLEKGNREWKVLKLAGVYALMSNETEISEKNYIYAISMAEELGDDLERFIRKSQRLPHEIMVDMFAQGADSVSLHNLIKKKLIKKAEELYDITTAANSTGTLNGLLKVDGSDIIIERFEHTDEVVFSYAQTLDIDKIAEAQLEADPSMDEHDAIKAGKVAVGLDVANKKMKRVETSFDNLENLVSNPVAFIAGVPDGGQRGGQDLIEGSSLIVLDIDDGEIPFDEIEIPLADYKFIAAQTSDVNNPFKYRILLESDIKLKLDTAHYKALIKKIGELIGLPVDLLPQSQLMYGYAGREVISNLEGEKIPAAELMKGVNLLPEGFNRRGSRGGSDSLEKIYDNRHKFFAYAYNIRRGGQRIHKRLHDAARHLYNKGFSYNVAMEIYEEILESCDTTKPGWRDGILRSMKRWWGET